MSFAQTISIEDRRVGTVVYDTDPARQAADYVDGLLETLQMAARGALPKGYRQTSIDRRTVSKWLELKVVQGISIEGPKYRVIIVSIGEYLGTQIHTAEEQEFLTGVQKAIALNREVVESGEEVVVYLLDDAPPEPLETQAEPKVDPDAKANLRPET